MNQIIAGTMTWGSWGRNFSSNQIGDLIDYCVDLGLTCFDHADIYGGYTTEKDFGQGIKYSKTSREKLTYISKCGIQYPCEERPLKVKHYNYSKSHIVSSVESSLKNLNTDYLDLLLLHRPSPLMNVDEIATAFSALSKEGKVRNFGVSNFTPSQMSLLAREVTIKWNQVECSLSHNIPMFDGTLDHHQTHGIGTMAWSPLGNYFKEQNETNTRLKPLIELIATKHQVSVDQILLAWIMQHPAKIHPVIGTTQKQRLEDALLACKINLDIEDWFVLLEAQLGHKIP